MKEALFYTKLENAGVRCSLCPHGCVIQNGARGVCRVRENRDGTLYALNYRNCISRRADPIEKKPLYHFQPGSGTYSFAAPGCNFRCVFCQNYMISQIEDVQAPLKGIDYAPEDIVKDALAARCSSVAYTYTEPTVFIEYCLDTMPLAKEKGLKNVFVSNGYINPEIISGRLAGLLDAINIDLKFFSDEAYKKFCGGRLEPVKESIAAYKKAGVWVEVTTLVIPGLNDSDRELSAIAGFIASVDRSIPWHVSRFHGDYKMTQVERTPVETIARACNTGLMMGLRYVYGGNMKQEMPATTYCPHCHQPVATRSSFALTGISLVNGACPHCKTPVDGVWT